MNRTIVSHRREAAQYPVSDQREPAAAGDPPRVSASPREPLLRVFASSRETSPSAPNDDTPQPMTDTIYVLNGPNLNLLGTREPEIYGHDTLDDIAGQLEDRARELDLDIDMRQSNHEGHLVDWLHEAQARGAKAVILNAGAFTHTSIAVHDAIKGIRTPVIEVHLSNPHTREDFRHVSFVGRAAKGTIAGFGALSYMLALEAAARF